MSKRRKNAGAGYGYMFSGAFAKKADAVKKEKKRKGSFVKAVMMQSGMRYAVMTPRTNPVKRKKKAEKETKAEAMKRRLAEEQAHAHDRELMERARGNPSELLVLGANPHEREITLPPNTTITIRTNPEPRENIQFGFLPARPTRADLVKSRREFQSNVRRKTKEMREDFRRMRRSARASVKDKKKLETLFHEVYGRNPICGATIGGLPCSRQPGHKGPHLPQGATMRTRTRLPHRWQPRGNPTAEALREKFTGRAVERVQIYDEPHMPQGDYAMLGRKVTLYVKPRTGGQVQMIQMQGTIAVSDESARQIYFVGGDQDVSAELQVFGAVDRGAGISELGEARRIDYTQRKEHVPDPEVDNWRHEFGEETGVRPTVLFDGHAKRILLQGGEYEIRTEGIVN